MGWAATTTGTPTTGAGAGGWALAVWLGIQTRATIRAPTPSAVEAPSEMIVASRMTPPGLANRRILPVR